ncbi:MAG: GNAT family N-acetyltransferase [Oscillospiraceae bacterium]|nr:GNAT family N-acetyltransferase [Oscillospiraceae bacterium]
MVTRAAAADIAALTDLWQAVFGDTPEEIAPFFQHVFPQSVGFCVRVDSSLGGMVFCVPCDVVRGEATFRCGYLYALGVREDLRGQKLGRTLADAVRRYAEEEKLAAVLTLPAEPSLFAYYADLGYQPWSWATECSFGAQAGGVTEISPQDYLSLRRTYLDNIGAAYLAPSEGVAALHRFFAWDGGCCAVGGGLVTELCGSAKGAPAVAEKLGVPRLSAIRCGSGYPFVAALPLQDDFPTDGLFSFGMQ